MRPRQRSNSRERLLWCLVGLPLGLGCGGGPLRLVARDAAAPDRSAAPDAPVTPDALTEISDVSPADRSPDLPAEARHLAIEARDQAAAVQDLATEVGPSEVANIDAGIGADACVPLRCHDPNCGFEYCGTIGDGCGGTLDCGKACRAGWVCDEAKGMCMSDAICVPLSCDNGTPSRYCGDIGDGCGGVLHCGTDCGRTGWACENHICVGRQPGCELLTCDAPSERLCGKTPDGCGGILDCGLSCPEPGWICSGTGRCVGGPDCVPVSCDGPSGEKYCGAIGNGCGGSLLCASLCPDTRRACRDNLCVEIVGCTKLSCVLADGGRYCGVIGDGCGGAQDCGMTCPDGSACGSVRAHECGAGTASPPPAAPKLPLPAPPVPDRLAPPPPPPPPCPPPPPAPQPG